MTKLNASCYLVLKSTRVVAGIVREINISRMTKTKPHLEPGEIAIRAKVIIAPDAFEPSVAQIVVGPTDDTYIPDASVDND